MHEPQKTERRVAVRWKSSQQTPCHFATLERVTARWATVLDVSLQGIGLVLPCELQPGKEIIIEFPCKDSADAKAVIAHVVRSNLLTPGNWSIGCIFVRPLDQNEIDMLL